MLQPGSTAGVLTRLKTECTESLHQPAEVGLEGMMSEENRRIHWLLWPFAAIWRLVASIVELTGRLVAVILGAAFMIVGAIISVTVIGAVVGIPLGILGFMMVLRGLF